jgi:heterotetrameric sarcosine oxidase gamma subunit
MADLARRSVAEQLGIDRDPAVSGLGVAVCVLEPGRQMFVSGGYPDLAPNTLIGSDPYTLWLAPNRVLTIFDDERCEVPDGAFASDVTDGLALFELTGPRVPELLAIGCPLDLQGPDLALGRCAQSLLAGVKIILYRRGEAIRLHVERPLARFVLDWLRQAATALG